MVLTPGTVSTPSKDEGNTIVVPEINQVHTKQEASTKVETNKTQSIKEDAVIQNDKDKNEEQIKVKNLGVNLKGKGRNSKKRIKKKLAKKTSEIVLADNKVMIEETHRGVSVKEPEDKLPESSNGRGRKPKRKREKKVVQNGSDEGKQELSTKKKDLKKVESMGMVFICSSKTKADCFQYKILGLPASKKDEVAKIYKGMRLFLFDVDLRLMYGIFKAVGPGGYNIEPKAFKSAFPSQVRFTVIEDCLPLAEENFRKVIKENYYSRNKFNGLLNSQQVKKLCKLFIACKSGPSPKKTINSHRNGTDAYKARNKEKCERRAHKEERRPHPSFDREQKRYHEYGQPPVGYQREALPSPVRHVARYLPQEVAPLWAYGYERTYPYARDPVLEHRPYHVLDTDNHHHLYSREAPSIYRDDVYPPSRDQMMEYHHHHHQPPPAAMLPSQYHLVSREYHSHISGGGLQVRGYHDVGQTSDYFPSSAPRTRYGY